MVLGESGGILTQSLLLSYHVFSKLHEIRINIGYFYDFVCYNFFNPFA